MCHAHGSVLQEIGSNVILMAHMQTRLWACAQGTFAQGPNIFMQNLVRIYDLLLKYYDPFYKLNVNFFINCTGSNKTLGRRVCY